MTSGTLGIVAGFALWVAPAHAATVTSNWAPNQPNSGIEVKAAPGEQNRLTARFAGDMLILHDPAGLQATPSCFADDPQTVRCPIGGESLGVSVFLGDGDDRFEMPRTTAKVTVDGGEGDDTITVEGDSSRGGDLARVLGGPGNDHLSGEAVTGGPGDDVIEADIHLDYSDHTTGVTIDLARGTATSAEGDDRIVAAAWEGWAASIAGGPGPDVIRAAPGRRLVVEAGAGDDVIEGGTGNDLIDGGPGDDVLRGGGGYDELDGDEGDDRLEGGSGRDALGGGPGDDVLVGRGGRDSLNGGDGADRISARDGERDIVVCSGLRMDAGDRATVDAGDDVRACVDVRRSGTPRLEVQGVVRSTRDSQLVQVSCPRGARPRACSGRFRLTLYQETSVTRTVRVAPGRTARLRFALARETAYRYRVTLRTGAVLRGTLGRVQG